MPFLRIPPSALPGLRAISTLESKQVEKLAKYLGEAHPGIKMSAIAAFVNQEFGLTSKQSEDITKALYSFKSLLEPVDVDLEDLADKVVASYKEVKKPEESEGNLKNNLILIFKNYKSLKLTLKAETLFLHETAVYRESKIVTDIRIIFSDDLNEQDRNAILVHNLNIEFWQESSVKNFHVSMTMEDLKQLQGVIERAISKEGIISSEYKADFNFINAINK